MAQRPNDSARLQGRDEALAARRVPVRVLIIEDHPVTRRGLRAVLDDSAVEVVGEAGRAREGIEVAARLRPDVVLLDVRLPDMGGTEVLKALKATQPSIAVLIYTAFPDMLALSGAIENGAAGFLLKGVEGEDILGSVKRIAAGELLLAAPHQRHLLMQIAAHCPGPPLDQSPCLTPRELEVLRALSHGLNAEQTVQLLNISMPTYRTHVQSILKEFGVTDRLQAVVRAFRTGLVTFE